MNLTPLHDRVIVKASQPEEVTKGGIIIPDTAKEKPQEGKIVAVGSGKMVGDKIVPLDVKVGDKVMFSKYGGDEIKVDGKELKILQESDILAVIE